jgi:hypothetical protein
MLLNINLEINYKSQDCKIGAEFVGVLVGGMNMYEGD